MILITVICEFNSVSWICQVHSRFCTSFLPCARLSRVFVFIHQDKNVKHEVIRYCGEHNYDVFATSMIMQPLETMRQPAQQHSVLSKLMYKHEHICLLETVIQEFRHSSAMEQQIQGTQLDIMKLLAFHVLCLNKVFSKFAHLSFRVCFNTLLSNSSQLTVAHQMLDICLLWSTGSNFMACWKISMTI